MGGWDQGYTVLKILRLHCYLVADVLKAGSWSVLEELDDPDFRRLVDTLSETLLKSRADSTTKKYLGMYKR